MKNLFFLLFIFCCTLSKAQLPDEVFKIDSIIYAAEKARYDCWNSGTFKNYELKEYSSVLTDYYEEFSKIYVDVLKKYLNKDEDIIINNTILSVDSTYAYLQELNNNIFGRNTEYELGYESVFCAERIQREHLKYKYELLRKYILCISERKEYPLEIPYNFKK